MYHYTEADSARRLPEAGKGSEFSSSQPDHRGAFARDRARVLHSAALRRLADKTQVVGPREGDTPRTRLTHSLEVAQISRGLGAGLGLDPDLAELAGLCHDIGHPPYGHNGEEALNEVAADCGGFEGNAQTLRILTKLEPKVVSAAGESYGLNLSRAALDAACKYPRTKTNPDGSINAKYGAYDEDAAILHWLREGHTDREPAMEAQVMDWCDDIAYSVHDVEDGIVSGRVDLGVLWDLVELAALAEKGARAFGGDPTQLIDAAGGLRELAVVNEAAGFDGTLRSYASLKRMTSELVGRYVGVTIGTTVDTGVDQADAAHGAADAGVGRASGTLRVPEQALAEVSLLKTIAVLYVMDDPGHIARQDRQRDRIFRVFDYLTLGAPGSLDPLFRGWWEEAETDAARQRVIVDQIATMTESRLERMARYSASLSSFLA